MNVALRKRKLPSGSETYFLDYRKNGDRFRESLGIVIHKNDPKRVEKKRVASERRAQREIEILRGKDRVKSDHLQNIVFSDFAELFISDYRKRDTRIIASAVTKFNEMVANDSLRVNQVTPDLMERFKDYLIHDAGLSGETAHNYFTRFKKVLKAAKLKGIISEMPTADIRFSNPNREDTLKKQVLDEEELQILANTHCGNPEVKRAFLFACFTSLGLSEIRVLKWSHIKRGRLITKRSKTGEEINIMLAPAALKIAGEHGKSDEYIFGLQSISTNAVNKNIRVWTKRAGLEKKLTFYCGRHTFACRLLTAGADLRSVASSMGHRSIKTTIKYLNHVQKLQDQGTANLPGFEI